MHCLNLLQFGWRKKKRKYVYLDRAEGGIEPLSCYTPTDLKSAHHTSDDHPRTLFVSCLIGSGGIQTHIDMHCRPRSLDFVLIFTEYLEKQINVWLHGVCCCWEGQDEFVMRSRNNSREQHRSCRHTLYQFSYWTCYSFLLLCSSWNQCLCPLKNACFESRK